MIIMYGISNCDTVKKARAWLTAQGLAHQFHDFKKAGVPADRLAIWAKTVGWPALLNQQGTTWRKLDAAAQAAANTDAGAMALALGQPSVIKRPVVEWPTSDLRITVGFKPDQWAQWVPMG